VSQADNVRMATPGAPGGAGGQGAGARRTHGAGEQPTEEMQAAQQGAGPTPNVQMGDQAVNVFGGVAHIHQGEGGPVTVGGGDGFVRSHRRGLKIAGVALGSGLALLLVIGAIKGCESGPGTITTGQQGLLTPSSGQPVTPQSGAQNGFGSTQTSTSTTPAPATNNPTGPPAHFSPESHPPGQVDSLTANYDNDSGNTATNVFLKLQLPNGQDAQFDSTGAVQCDVNATITAQYSELHWVYCPSVPAGDHVALMPANWDNKDPGNTTVWMTSNGGVGPNGSPPPHAHWQRVEYVDVLG
jgi:hypothetical protein